MISDGETITLRRFKQSLGGGVICALFNSTRDEVSLDLTFPVEKKYTLFVDANDHPSARIHLTGYTFLFYCGISFSVNRIYFYFLGLL